jgi:hypothetical protein
VSMCAIWEKSQNKWVERGAMTMSDNALWFHPLSCSPSSSGSLDVGGACGGNEAQAEKTNVDTHIHPLFDVGGTIKGSEDVSHGFMGLPLCCRRSTSHQTN